MSLCDATDNVHAGCIFAAQYVPFIKTHTRPNLYILYNTISIHHGVSSLHVTWPFSNSSTLNQPTLPASKEHVSVHLANFPFLQHQVLTLPRSLAPVRTQHPPKTTLKCLQASYPPSSPVCLPLLLRCRPDGAHHGATSPCNPLASPSIPYLLRSIPSHPLASPCPSSTPAHRPHPQRSHPRKKLHNRHRRPPNPAFLSFWLLTSNQWHPQSRPGPHQPQLACIHESLHA